MGPAASGDWESRAMPSAARIARARRASRFAVLMTDDPRASSIPPEPGDLPTATEPDPAPERDELMPVGDGEQDPLGQPVGRDNIREGRVGGVMAPPMGSHGEGQGG